MVITLQLISTLRIFSQVYVMTNGGPAGASSSPIHYIYSVAIVRKSFRLLLGFGYFAVRCHTGSYYRAAVRHSRDGVMRNWLESKGMRLSDVPVWIIGMGVAFIWASPFLWMVSASFKFPADVMTQTIEWIPRRVTINNYLKVFEYPIVRWTINSFVQAITSTTICVFFGAMAGFALAQFRFPGRAAIFMVFLASLMIPVEVSVIPMLLAFIKIGWASTYQALILPTIANVFSIYIFVSSF